MPSPIIQKLLILQDRDVRCDNIHSELAHIPREIAKYQGQIEAENQKLEALRQEIKTLEVQRHDVDTRVKGEEDQLNRYKNQQLAVKKNEEYKALQHEIENTEKHISNLETEELEIMEQIDEKKEELNAAEATAKETIAELQGHIATMRKREEAFRADLDEAQQAVDTARAAVDPKALKVYLYLKERSVKPPYVVPMNGQKCGGCYIKVSSESESAARNPTEVARCDNCGRILFFDSIT